MENYRLIAQQSYDNIGREIKAQLESNPQTNEVRFVRVFGTKLMYYSYVTDGTSIPQIDGFIFADVGSRKELTDRVNHEFKKDMLPQEVRVIRPLGRDTWGIFIKQ